MKLTPAERKWLRAMQTLLDECPSDRLGFYTIGDPQISVYDYRKEAEIHALMDAGKANDFPIAVDELDAHVSVLDFPHNVHSVAG